MGKCIRILNNIKFINPMSEDSMQFFRLSSWLPPSIYITYSSISGRNGNLQRNSHITAYLKRKSITDIGGKVNVSLFNK